MKEIKAKATFSLNGVIYEKGDVINTKDINEIIRLNEKGFIEPLTPKDIQTIEKNLKEKPFKSKEEKED